MLTGLRLGNFKAFAETQRLPIRPLTLIFGANSSGKSSLIHGLLLARHAMETGELDIHRTAIGGESVDLGGFRQYVHRREAARRFEWAGQIDVALLQGRLAELVAPVHHATIALSVGIELGNQGEPVPDTTPGVMSYEIEADGISLLRMSRRRDGHLQLDRLDHEHPVFRGVIRAIVETATTTEALTATDFEGLDDAIAALVPEITVQVEKFLPTGLVRSEHPVGGIDQPTLFPISQGRRREDLAAAVSFFLPRTLDELIRGSNDAVARELSRLRYLGPLRSYPPRHLAFSQHHDPNWFAGGGYAWEVVRRDESVRAAVNAWLGSEKRLQTSYELVVRDLVPDRVIARELSPKIAKALHDMVRDLLRPAAAIGDEHQSLDLWAAELSEALERATPEEILPDIEGIISNLVDPDTVAEKWTRELARANVDQLRDLVLIDKRTNTPVSHRDIGIGISQVLPVLVAAYASAEKILAIEQPEIHLHPALQAELGDVFIESALGGRRNTFILETHSEHLILRILRRIRETTDDELPPGITPIRPEDVAVLYVLPDKDGAKVVEIPIRPDGEFAERWPQGFFAERAKELF
jgi:predicted ATPase